MRILFTTFAARTHFFAQVPLATALRYAGHEVVVASQPDIIDDIVSAGLSAVAVGAVLDIEPETQQANDSFDDRNLGGLAMSNSRHDHHTWESALGMFTAMTSFVFQNVCSDDMIDDVVRFADQWRPDLVIWDPLTLAGPVAARSCGAAHARLLFGPDQMARNRAAFVAEKARVDPARQEDPLLEWLGWTLDRIGCPSAEIGEEMVVGQWTIDPTPTSMRAPLDLNYVPMRYIPYNGKSIIPSWIYRRDDRPRICVTLGASLGETPDGGITAATNLLAAVDGLDATVIATLPAALRARLGPLPANVEVVEFISLNALLPTCAAIVHHGGSGTFLTALSHGVPQLIVPDMMWDSMEKCLGLVDAGAGVFVESLETMSAADLRQRISTLIADPSYLAGAERVRVEMLSTPGPNEIVPAIERLTANFAALERGPSIPSGSMHLEAVRS